MIKKPDDYEMIDTYSGKSLFGKFTAIFFILLAVIGAISAYAVMNKKNQYQNLTQNSTSSPQTSEAQSIRSAKTFVSPQNLPKETLSTEIGSASAVKEIIYFSFDDTKILSTEVSKLNSFWSKEKKGKGIVIIEGHTDNVGNEVYNQQLSILRAESVADRLRKLGMDNRYQVTIRGFGETKLISNNNTPEGRAINRRVVISFQE